MSVGGVRLLVLLSVLVLAIAVTAISQEASVSITSVQHLWRGELTTFDPGTEFHFRIVNNSVNNFRYSTNGFRIYSPDSATWTPGFFIDTGLICDFIPNCTIFDTTFYGKYQDYGLPQGMARWYPWRGSPGVYQNNFINWASADGTGADTVGFAGFAFDNTGRELGFFSGFVADPGWSIRIGQIPTSSKGKTICIDSSWYRPAGEWRWGNNDTVDTPSWDGPYCWRVSDREPYDVWHYVSLDSVRGFDKGRLQVETPISLFLRFTTAAILPIDSITNGFRLYSPDGATWEPGLVIDTHCVLGSGPECSTVIDTNLYGRFVDPKSDSHLVWHGSDPQIFDGDLAVEVFSANGSGADTIGFSGFKDSSGTGIVPFFGETALEISIARIPASSAGKTLCLDSAFIFPEGKWSWTSWYKHPPYRLYMRPYWDGPYCFEIGDCCVGRRGNVDLTDDEINIADLTSLIHEVFVKLQLRCPSAGNVDNDSSDTVDILDVLYLVDYMFRGGPEPAACP